MNPAELFEHSDNHYDYVEAFGVIGDKYWVDGDVESGTVKRATPDDVAEVIAHHIDFGDYAETEVWILGRLKDGRYFFLNSSCDTTGWDCQAGGHAYVASTLDKVEAWGMTLEERRALKLPDRCTAHEDCRQLRELGAACLASRPSGGEPR